MIQDLNIGTALWLAAGGDGWVSEEIGGDTNSVHGRVKYKSDSRILLVGSGADEQCAGYGRHRTKYRQSRLVSIPISMWKAVVLCCNVFVIYIIVKVDWETVFGNYYFTEKQIINLISHNDVILEETCS